MTTTPIETPTAEAVAEQPRLAAGVELIGEYKDSGFKDPPYLVRRGDGQVIQLPRLLYLVAEAADGTRDCAEIGEHVAPSSGAASNRMASSFLSKRNSGR